MDYRKMINQLQLPTSTVHGTLWAKGFDHAKNKTL